MHITALIHEEMALDIGDFLKEEIKGPATFSCKTGTGCKFEEPAMNDLINSIFGDGYITLQCEDGECLHYSQVPGYVVRYSLVLFIHTKFILNHFSVPQSQTILAGWLSVLQVPV